jgi:protein-L-isoaspartate O-methyltransferase
VTISAPYIHATCLEILREAVTAPGCRVLDVGSGSGILLAYMARMAPPSSTLVGVEIVQRLVDVSVANLRSDGFDVGDPPADGRHCRIEVLPPLSLPLKSRASNNTSSSSI